MRYAGQMKSALPVQINTTFSRRNIAEIDEIVALMEKLKITLWSVFFLVPTGRGKLNDLLSAEEFESVFAKVYSLSRLQALTSRRQRRSITGALSCNRESPSERRDWVSIACMKDPSTRSGARHVVLTTARGSSSFRTKAKSSQAAFFLSQLATSVKRNWPRFIATRPCSAICATRRSSRESAAPANSRRSAEDREPAHTP